MTLPSVRQVMSTLASGVKRAGVAVFRFIGPVADSVKGELTKEEHRRILTKAAVTFGGTWTSLSQLLHDSEIKIVLASVGFALVVGFLDAAKRYQDGQDKPVAVLPPIDPAAPPAPPSDSPAVPTP